MLARSPRCRFRTARVVLPAVAVALAVLATACGDESGPATPAADAVSMGSTSTTSGGDAPPVVVAGAAGPDGHRRVILNPDAWEGIAATFVDDDPTDRYHELHSDGHDDFWFGVELHPDVGPGWTGERGLFATDCAGAGICVRFDPDGGAGPMGPLLAEPSGEVEIEAVEEGDYSMIFRNLIFRREDTLSYRIDSVTIEAS